MAGRKCGTPKLETATREALSPLSTAHANARRPKIRCKTPKTPGSAKKQANVARDENCAYDRFIPNRALMDPKVCHYQLFNEENTASSSINDANNVEMEHLTSQILQMKIKAAPSNEGDLSSKLLYSSHKQTPLKSKSSRHIPSAADKILDAPDVCNDFYLNLLDWGSNGLLAIALLQSVYVWNSQSGVAYDLFANNPISDDNLTITSIKWIDEGDFLAMGLSNGDVQIWDAVGVKRTRTMPSHAFRVGCLDWNEYIATSGCKDGSIHNHDVRVPKHHVSSFKSHRQDVCGMQWNKRNIYHLASGANDNTLNIWDLRKVNGTSDSENPIELDTPVMSLTEHTAAVKAVAWCPWQRNVLASGGGLLDRHIRFWNTERSNGVCVQSIDTMDQVSTILWSGTYHEVIASHGNHLSIWKHPSMQREKLLSGHTERILCMAMAPDGVDVATVAADETIRLWKCFEPPPKKATMKKEVRDGLTFNSIR